VIRFHSFRRDAGIPHSNNGELQRRPDHGLAESPKGFHDPKFDTVPKQRAKHIVNRRLGNRFNGLTAYPVSRDTILQLEHIGIKLVPNEPLRLDLGDSTGFDGDHVRRSAGSEQSRHIGCR
jgi:hypothetical protein